MEMPCPVKSRIKIMNSCWPVHEFCSCFMTMSFRATCFWSLAEGSGESQSGTTGFFCATTLQPVGPKTFSIGGQNDQQSPECKKWNIFIP